MAQYSQSWGCAHFPRDVEIVPLIAPNKLVCLVGGCTSLGAGFHIWDANPNGDSAQRFKLIPTGVPRQYTLRVQKTGKLLCVEGARHESGVKIHQWFNCNLDDQKVYIDNIDGRPTAIVFAHSGKSLDVAGGNQSNGTVVHQWDSDSNNPNQKFRILPAGSTVYRFNPNDEFRIRCINSGLYFDIPDGKDERGTRVVTGEAHSVRFHLVPRGQELYSIHLTHCDYALQVDGYESRAHLHMSDKTGGANEVFHIPSVNGLPVQITATHTGKVLDVLDHRTEAGVPIIQWDNTKVAANQYFVIERVIPGF